MATVLEELLIKIGFDVNKDGLAESERAIDKAISGATKADQKQGKVAKDRLKTWENTSDQLDANKKKTKEYGKAEDASLSRRKALNKGLNDAKGLLGKVAGGWVMAGAAVATYAARSSQIVDANIKVSRSIGMQTEDVQAFAEAAKRNGASAESAISSLSSLTNIIGQTLLGNVNHGLDLTRVSVFRTNGELKNAKELFLDIADGMRDLEPAEQMARASLLGLSGDMLPFLQQSRYDAESLINEMRKLGVVSSDIAKDAENANDAWSNMFQVIGAGSRSVGAKLLSLTSFIPKAVTAAATTDTVGAKKSFSASPYAGYGFNYSRSPVASKPKATPSSTVINSPITINAKNADAGQVAQEVKKVLRDEIRTAKNNNDQQGEL